MTAKAAIGLKGLSKMQQDHECKHDDISTQLTVIAYTWLCYLCCRFNGYSTFQHKVLDHMNVVTQHCTIQWLESNLCKYTINIIVVRTCICECPQQ